MNSEKSKVVRNNPEFVYRLRPVATPSGFKYTVERRPASMKYAPIWNRVVGPVSKDEGDAIIASFGGAE